MRAKGAQSGHGGRCLAPEKRGAKLAKTAAEAWTPGTHALQEQALASPDLTAWQGDYFGTFIWLYI